MVCHKLTIFVQVVGIWIFRFAQVLRLSSYCRFVEIHNSKV